MTTKIEPDTPLLAGNPIVQAHSPEKSYMPHERRSWTQFFTTSLLINGFLVMGHRPPVAKVPAMMAIDLQVTCNEQTWK